MDDLFGKNNDIDKKDYDIDFDIEIYDNDDLKAKLENDEDQKNDGQMNEDQKEEEPAIPQEEKTIGQVGTTGFVMVEPSHDSGHDKENSEQAGEGQGVNPFSSTPSREEYNYAGTQPMEVPGKPKRGRRIIAAVLLVALCFGAGFGGSVAAIYYGQNYGLFTVKNNVTITPDDTPDRGEAIAEKVIPSVVGISTQTKKEINMNWFYSTEQVVEGVGTGIIVDERGYILTNSHVIDDGNADNITVQLTDGREVPGTVVWNDKSIDVAVVKIDVTGLVAAELGDSDEMRIGSYVAAIGNPLGLDYDRSMSQGIISGLNRTITVSESNGQNRTTMEGLLQTDASINSGNSGGPLLNSSGQVIGVNTAKASLGEGIGFAIPINNVKSILEEVQKTGTYSKAFIGIVGNNASDYSTYYNLELGVDYGAIVIEVVEGSPAEKSGIQKMDVITSMDGKRINTISELTGRLFNYSPGDTVSLTVYRDGESQTIEVTLTENKN